MPSRLVAPGAEIMQHPSPYGGAAAALLAHSQSTPDSRPSFLLLAQFGLASPHRSALQPAPAL